MRGIDLLGSLCSYCVRTRILLPLLLLPPTVLSLQKVAYVAVSIYLCFVCVYTQPCASCPTPKGPSSAEYQAPTQRRNCDSYCRKSTCPVSRVLWTPSVSWDPSLIEVFYNTCNINLELGSSDQRFRIRVLLGASWDVVATCKWAYSTTF